MVGVMLGVTRFSSLSIFVFFLIYFFYYSFFMISIFEEWRRNGWRAVSGDYGRLKDGQR